jgi:pyruvate formate-lyase activating enzyme-like uncharacterized protein
MTWAIYLYVTGAGTRDEQARFLWEAKLDREQVHVKLDEALRKSDRVEVVSEEEHHA